MSDIYIYKHYNIYLTSLYLHVSTWQWPIKGYDSNMSRGAMFKSLDYK